MGSDSSLSTMLVNTSRISRKPCPTQTGRNFTSCFEIADWSAICVNGWTTLWPKSRDLQIFTCFVACVGFAWSWCEANDSPYDGAFVLLLIMRLLERIRILDSQRASRKRSQLKKTTTCAFLISQFAHGQTDYSLLQTSSNMTLDIGRCLLVGRPIKGFSLSGSLARIPCFAPAPPAPQQLQVRSAWDDLEHLGEKRSLTGWFQGRRVWEVPFSISPNSLTGAG